MSFLSRRTLKKKLGNEAYREAYVSSRIAQTIAFQVRALRQREGLSQDELAKALETSQNAISRLENPSYGKPNISTLRRIASYFKVGLVVRFGPLSEIAGWSENLTPDVIDIPNLDNDSGFDEEVSAGVDLAAFSNVIPFPSGALLAETQTGRDSSWPEPETGLELDRKPPSAETASAIEDRELVGSY